MYELPCYVLALRASRCARDMARMTMSCACIPDS